jgi:hypothetical protein
VHVRAPHEDSLGVAYVGGSLKVFAKAIQADLGDFV